jgi:hypothetical protein
MQRRGAWKTGEDAEKHAGRLKWRMALVVADLLQLGPDETMIGCMSGRKGV